MTMQTGWSNPLEPADAAGGRGVSGPHEGQALILVVERDPHVRNLERYFLEKAGYGVEFADNGRVALERALVLRPRILIAEILIPEIDGLAVCRRIKEQPETRDIAVLIFSILAAEGRAREAGADAFLRKPLDDAMLVHRVDELLRRHAQTKGDDDGTR